MYLMPIIFLSLIVVAVFYVSKRLAWAFSLNPKILAVALIALVIFFLVTIVVIMQTNKTSGISHILNNISSIGVGFFAIMLFTVLAVDLVQLFVKAKPQIFGLVVIGITVLVTGYSLWNAQNIRAYQKDIKLPNLVEPVRIAQISDTHFGHFWGKRAAQKVVDIVKSNNVDFAVITGDMFDGRVRLTEEVLQPFKELNVPIYFVEGNHDGYSGSSDIKQLLRKNGINVLTNEKVEYKGLQIVGLDYLTPDRETVDRFHAPPSGLTMKDVLPTLGIDKNRASVLLHHNPVGANYASENGLNLYLAGHTHAGQMFPSTLVAKAMFKFNKGLYKYNETLQIYVSQGSGTFGPPMRLGTHSEVTIINLTK